ncbi:MAG: peptidylprolyl isomerase [Bacteroidia bacterium]
MLSGVVAGMWGCGKEAETHTGADVVLITDAGEIGIAFYEEAAGHAENFRKLAASGFYDSLAFHRVIDGFMIQVGDPRTRATYPVQDTAGEDGPGYTLAPELSDQRFHVPGAVGSARWGDELNPERRSSGSQFYIVCGGKPVSPRKLDSVEVAYTGVLRGRMLLAYQAARDSSGYTGSFDDFLAEQQFRPFSYPPAIRQTYEREGGAPWLDFEYTIFGRVVSGAVVAEVIGRKPTDRYDRPAKALRIHRIVAGQE